MSSTGQICAICAWRATCQKKFTISGRDLRCAEFVRDVSIKEEPAEELDKEKDNKKQKKQHR
jgi:hypothetical protein